MRVAPRRCCLCPSKIIERTITLPTGEKLYTCPLHSRLDEGVIVRAWEVTAKAKSHKQPKARA